MGMNAEDVRDWTSCAYDMFDRLPGAFARMARDRVAGVSDVLADDATPEECEAAYETVTGIVHGLYLTTDRIAYAVQIVMQEYAGEDVAGEFGFLVPADYVAHARNVLTLPGRHVMGAMPIEYEGTKSDIAFVIVVAATDDMITAALGN